MGLDFGSPPAAGLENGKELAQHGNNVYSQGKTFFLTLGIFRATMEVLLSSGNASCIGACNLGFTLILYTLVLLAAQLLAIIGLFTSDDGMTTIANLLSSMVGAVLGTVAMLARRMMEPGGDYNSPMLKKAAVDKRDKGDKTIHYDCRFMCCGVLTFFTDWRFTVTYVLSLILVLAGTFAGDATVQSILTFIILEIIEQLSLNMLTGQTPKVTEVLSHFLTLGIIQVDLFTCF